MKLVYTEETWSIKLATKTNYSLLTLWKRNDLIYLYLFMLFCLTILAFKRATWKKEKAFSQLFSPTTIFH